MRYRVLGKTNLKVSAIGFGAWAIGGSGYKGYGPTDDATSLAALNKAYELGCNFFDTADVYGCGKSETLIGQALKGWRREEVLIASKVGFEFSDPENPRQVFSDKHIKQACEASLQRLGIDCIDIYQLHNPSLELIQLGRMFNVLQALQAEGKIRHYGISIHDPQEGIQAVDIGGVQTVQAIYNLFDRRPEHGDEHSLLRYCQQNQIGLIVREPFARGFLTGSFDPDRQFDKSDNRSVWPKPLIQKRWQAAEQYKKAIPTGYPDLGALALQFALSQPAVSTVIPGCKTPEQVVRNFSVAELPSLTSEEMARLHDVQQAIF